MLALIRVEELDKAALRSQHSLDLDWQASTTTTKKDTD